MPPKKKRDFASEFGVGRMQFEEPPPVDELIGVDTPGDMKSAEFVDRAAIDRVYANPLLFNRPSASMGPVVNNAVNAATQEVRAAPTIAKPSPSTAGRVAANYKYNPAAKTDQTAKKFDGPMMVNYSTTNVNRTKKTPNAELMDAHGRARNDASAFQHQATEETRDMGEMTKKYEESINATKKWYDGKKDDQGVNELIESQGAKDAYSVAQQEYQEAAARGVDPNRIWKNGANQTMASMFIALGAFGASLSGRKNGALNIVMSAVDRDIAAQKGQIDRTTAAKKDSSSKAWRNIDRVTQKLGIDRAELHKERAMRLHAFGDIYGKKIAQAGRNVNMAQANAGAEAVKAGQLLSASASLASTTSSRTVSGQKVNPAYAAFMKTPKYKVLSEGDKKRIFAVSNLSQRLTVGTVKHGFNKMDLVKGMIPGMTQNQGRAWLKTMGHSLAAMVDPKVSGPDAKMFGGVGYNGMEWGEAKFRRSNELLTEAESKFQLMKALTPTGSDPKQVRELDNQIRTVRRSRLLMKQAYEITKAGGEPNRDKIVKRVLLGGR